MKEFRVPKSEKLMGLIQQFSPTEKVLFGILTIVFVFCGISLFWKLNTYFMVEVPTYGGEVKEGVIGIARFINPVLAQTDVDRDLTSLVYAGLMRNVNGELVPDIAEKYTLSDDGLVYTFDIKESAKFHDGVNVSADDVAYTIEKAQDAIIKSPKRAVWNDVTVEVVNSHQIKLMLKSPFTPFIYNTTLGILPKHLWKNVDSDSFVFSTLNSDPIGAGPYKVDSVDHDGQGLPLSYELSSYRRYTLGRPFIPRITFVFFPNEKDMIEGYYSGTVTSIHSINATDAERIALTNRSQVLHTSLPRTFAVFFNQNQSPVLANKEVRQALDIAIDRGAIINDVLRGYGVKNDGPLPFPQATANATNTIDLARDILIKAGWTMNDRGVFEKKTKTTTTPLEVALTTTNATELKRTAELIKQNWEKVGATVSLKVYENGDLQQNIIRPRKYEALLFGMIVGRDLDLYAYWHSSQRNDPGLNIALYANSKVDKLLEEVRTLKDSKEAENKANQAEDLITDDVPAAFLYSPDMIYITPKKTNVGSLEHITTPSDRFGNVRNWYINVDHVWKIFVNNK